MLTLFTRRHRYAITLPNPIYYARPSIPPVPLLSARYVVDGALR